MAFVQAKCPMCGGMLAVDEIKKAAICQFCGDAFVVEEAVNNYITYSVTNNNLDNSVTHNYGDGAVINIYEDKSKDFVIEAGVLIKYQGASAVVVIPDGVLDIEKSCFQKSKIKSIVIPKSVNSIKDNAFFGCTNLTSITIPDSVTSIGDGAFCGCTSLTSIAIPDSVISIGFSAFSGCKHLISINVNENNSEFSSVDGVLYDKNKTVLVKCPLGKIECVIPDSVKKIGDGAFEGCSNLTRLKFPNGLTTIVGFAFHNCENLTTVTIPDSVTTIGSFAFSGCKNLTTVTIPDSVTTIGSFAFSGCKNLTTVTIPKNLTDCKAFSDYWKSRGLCQYCGGTFKEGFFSTKCTKCGEYKSY